MTTPNSRLGAWCRFTPNTGETRVPGGTASLIIAFSPAVVAVLSAIFLHERITLLKVGGLAISFVGLAIVVMVGEGIQLDVRNLGYYLLVFVAGVVAINRR